MKFEFWKTLRIPVRRHTGELRSTLQAGGFKLDAVADILLGKTALVKVETTIDLCKISVQDICFPDHDPNIYPGMVSYSKIIQQARELGLILLPPQAAVELRLHYTEQPASKFFKNKESGLTIATPDIYLDEADAYRLGRQGHDVYPGGRQFHLYHEFGYCNGIGLGSCGGYSSGASFIPSSLLVFGLPSK